MTPDALRAEMRASVPAPFNPDRVADRLIAHGMHLRSAPKPDADYYDRPPVAASHPLYPAAGPSNVSGRDEAASGSFTATDLRLLAPVVFLLGITLAAGGVL